MVPELHLHYLKAACLAVSCLLAWISFSSYERPIRAIGIVGGNAWRFLAIGTGTSAVIAVIGFLILSGTLARPSDAHLIAIKPRNPQTERTFAGSLHQTPNTSVFAPCEAILYPGRPVVLLFGDSHSGSLSLGLKPYLDSRHINLVRYTVTNCVPLVTEKTSRSCAGTYAYILARLRQTRPNLVILCADYVKWNDFDPSFGAFAVSQMAELRRGGSQNILIVGQMPIWSDTLPEMLNRQFLRLGQPAPLRTFTGLLPASLSIDEAMRKASDDRRVPYYSIHDTLCDAQGCLTRVGNRLPDDWVVYDDGHATVAAAQYLIVTGLGHKIESILGE
jgi:hypothetical protein